MELPLIYNLFSFQDFLVNFQVKKRNDEKVVRMGQTYQSASSKATAVKLVKARLEKEYEGKPVDVIVY